MIVEDTNKIEKFNSALTKFAKAAKSNKENFNMGKSTLNTIKNGLSKISESIEELYGDKIQQSQEPTTDYSTLMKNGYVPSINKYYEQLSYCRYDFIPPTVSLDPLTDGALREIYKDENCETAPEENTDNIVKSFVESSTHNGDYANEYQQYITNFIEYANNQLQADEMAQ